MLIEKHADISIRMQCALLDISPSTYYYEPGCESDENLTIMRHLDEVYLKYPFYGTRRMVQELNDMGYSINRKRIQRLMRLMGLQTIYPKPKTSRRNVDHVVHPYLLRNVNIIRKNQVWSSDITYIPIKGGYFYLTAVMDWFSRFVLGWQISNSMDSTFCLEALRTSFTYGKPEIFNTDQGSQYTSKAFTSILKDNEIQISMAGKGRCLDNVWIERLWRTVKQEEIYIREYRTGSDVYKGLSKYFHFYNFRRRHMALQYQTPSEVFLNQ